MGVIFFQFQNEKLYYFRNIIFYNEKLIRMKVNFSKRIPVYSLAIMILLSSFVVLPSCRTNNLSNKEREIQREKKRRAKDDTVLYQKALKRHMKNQTEATRKDMKRNYREAMRYNEQKKQFFLFKIIRDKMYQKQKKQKG